MSVRDTENSTLTIDKFDHIDSETRYRIAAKEENESKALLLYYRDKITTLDSEIQEWAQKLNQMDAAKDETYKQAQELQTKREEVADLQRSISESKLSIQNERLENLKLKRENDQLRLKELIDRKKIYELMMLNEPNEKENAFYTDLRPGAKGITNDLSLQFNKKGSKEATGKGVTGSQQYTKTGKDLIKAIYLPNEQLDTFTVENDSLKIRLDEERQAFEEHIAVLNEQLNIREEELSRRQEADTDKLQELMDKNRALTDYKNRMAKEFFAFRLEVNERKSRLLQEQEDLKVINNGLHQKILIHERKVEVDHKVTQEVMEKKAVEHSAKFRDQIRDRDEKLFLVKEQYAHVQKTCLNTLKNLEESLTKLANEYQTLDQRRMLEKEEFKSKTLGLDKRIKQFQRRYFNGQTIKLVGDKSKLKFDVNQMMREEDIHDAQEDVEHYEDEEEGNTTINSEELSLIKQQLAELESKLDRNRRLDI